MRFVKPGTLGINSLILDVRPEEEHQSEMLNLPHIRKDLKDLRPAEFMRANEIGRDKTLNILCETGVRAAEAAKMFEDAGFDNVSVIIGGIVEAGYEGLDIIRR